MPDTALYLLILAGAWFVSAGALLYVYYKVSQKLDEEYYRND